MLQIDGYEGGGQILRTALALSSLTNIPFEINNIRGQRENSGLKAQHLEVINTIKEISDAEVSEFKIGTNNLTFVPLKLKGLKKEIDIGTAGSITLFLQGTLMPLFFANKSSTIKIQGGTDTKWAMPYDYFKEIYKPHIDKFAKSFDINLLKRGYYPKGQGVVELKINPKFKLNKYENFEEFRKNVEEETLKMNLTERGELVQIRGICHASKDLENKDVINRMIHSAETKLKKYNVPIKIRSEYNNSNINSDGSIGCGIFLYGVFTKDGDINHTNPVRIGADCLGEIKKSSEKVGEEAANNLIEQIDKNAPVDKYLADNLVPWAIFGGKFRATEISNHTKLNVKTTNLFVKDKLKVVGDLVEKI